MATQGVLAPSKPANIKFKLGIYFPKASSAAHDFSWWLTSPWVRGEQVQTELQTILGLAVPRYHILFILLAKQLPKASSGSVRKISINLSRKRQQRTHSEKTSRGVINEQVNELALKHKHSYHCVHWKRKRLLEGWFFNIRESYMIFNF